MKIKVLTVGPMSENCYLVIDESTNHAVLIDPGDEADRILAAVRESGATLDAIWLTHAHFDHVGAIAGVLREYPVKVHMHPSMRRSSRSPSTPACDTAFASRRRRPRTSILPRAIGSRWGRSSSR
jgi:glyoxylase-like metal-dependent hydrolase (beta-lactamase superfamily II)